MVSRDDKNASSTTTFLPASARMLGFAQEEGETDEQLRARIVNALSSAGSQSTFRNVVEAFAGIITCYVPSTVPHGVMGQTDRPGQIRVHFLAPLTSENEEHVRARMRHILPMHVDVQITFAWCLKHTDCRMDDGLALLREHRIAHARHEALRLWIGIHSNVRIGQANRRQQTTYPLPYPLLDRGLR